MSRITDTWQSTSRAVRDSNFRSGGVDGYIQICFYFIVFKVWTEKRGVATTTPSLPISEGKSKILKSEITDSSRVEEKDSDVVSLWCVKREKGEACRRREGENSGLWTRFSSLDIGGAFVWSNCKPRNGESHSGEEATHLHRRSAHLVWNPSRRFSRLRFSPCRPLSPGTSFFPGLVMELYVFFFFWSCNLGFKFHFWKPSDGISKVVFGGQVTDEEAEALSKRWDLGFLHIFAVF